jgi:hypothetical protein
VATKIQYKERGNNMFNWLKGKAPKVLRFPNSDLFDSFIDSMVRRDSYEYFTDHLYDVAKLKEELGTGDAVNSQVILECFCSFRSMDKIRKALEMFPVDQSAIDILVGHVLKRGDIFHAKELAILLKPESQVFCDGVICDCFMKQLEIYRNGDGNGLNNAMAIMRFFPRSVPVNYIQALIKVCQKYNDGKTSQIKDLEYFIRIGKFFE